MDKRKQDIAYFISFCIEQYKNEKGITYKQAEDWVKRKMGERKVSKGYVCEYEFDETALHNLKALEFLKFVEAKEIVL